MWQRLQMQQARLSIHGQLTDMDWYLGIGYILYSNERQKICKNYKVSN